MRENPLINEAENNEFNTPQRKRRPRINELSDDTDNTEYINKLTLLNKQYRYYLSQLFRQHSRLGRRAFTSLPLQRPKEEVALTINDIAKHNRGTRVSELYISFNELDRKPKQFPYNYLSFQTKIQKALYFEHAKKLTSLITAYNQSQTPENKQKIDNCIAALDDKELFAVLNSAIDNFKEHPSDQKIKETNILLGYFHKKIVKETYRSAVNSHNIRENAIFEFNSRKAARADFNGGFYTPNYKDLARHNPFSAAYREFANRSYKPLTAKDDYDLKQCPAWQACLQSRNFQLLEPHFKKSLVALRIDPKILKSLNAIDIMDIMTPQEFSDRTDRYFISFQSLCPLCSIGEKQKFLNSLNASKMKNTMALISINHGKINGKQVHHNHPINTYGIQSNQSGFSVIPTYLTKKEREKQKYDITYDDMHDFMHRADLVLRPATKSDKNMEYIPVELDERHNGDTMYYMIDTREEECRKNGKIMVLSGLKENDFATIDLPTKQNKLTSKQNIGVER